MNTCPKCKGPTHPAFDCRRYIHGRNERGEFVIETFPNEEAARLEAERRNREPRDA